MAMATGLLAVLFCILWRAVAAASGRHQALWTYDEDNVLGAVQTGYVVTPQEWWYLSKTFLKCKVWQVEETMDAINCPYHYYCNTTYPGDYAIVADWLAMLLAAVACVGLIGVVIWEFRGTLFGREFSRGKARFCVPSGPVLFPLALVVLAKGYRINSVFPLAYIAPVWLQLLHISALGTIGYEIYGVSKNLNAVVFEVSMAVGMLHGGLYVDAVTLPYYTGLQASMSMPSGICRSCICRREPLVAGGTFFYRAWSYGSFVVVSALLSRLAYGLWWYNGMAGRLINLGRWAVELLAWGFTVWDVVEMMMYSPPVQQGLPYTFFMGPLAFILFLCLFKRLWNLYKAIKSKKQNPNIDYKAHSLP